MKTLRFLTAVAALACASTAFAQARPNGYSVVLLVGDTQGPTSLDNLPQSPGIRKALSDVKDFLPYHSYRVLDTQWLRSGMTRMKGADDQEYEVTVNADEFMRMPGGGVLPYDPASGKPPVIEVSFHLQEQGAAQNASEEFARAAAAADLEKQLAQVQANLADLSAKNGEQHPAVLQLKSRLAKLQSNIHLARARRLMDSKFQMAPGETVVVGTSKMGGGDKALVVLLTAVAGGK